MSKLAIRFIVSLGGDVPYQALEKDNKGEFVFYDFDTIEALRLVDAEYATPKDKKEYESAKANIEKLQAEKDAADKLVEDIKNLDILRAREIELKSELKDLTATIKATEAAISGK